MIASIVRALVVSGATPEMILAAVQAYEEALPELERRLAFKAMVEQRREFERQRAAKRRAECSPQEWDELRRQVFERDGFACVYCGSADDLQADHIVPHSKGGPSTLDNLATACGHCNMSKGAKSLADWKPN